jgi:hypothetical protein
MRNRSSYGWNSRHTESSGRGFGALRAIALFGGIALIAAPFVTSLPRSTMR